MDLLLHNRDAMSYRDELHRSLPINKQQRDAIITFVVALYGVMRVWPCQIRLASDRSRNERFREFAR